MPRQKIYPRREVNGAEFYVIASPNILENLAQIAKETAIDARELYKAYTVLLDKQTHQLSVDIGLPVTTASTDVGHDWLIPANRFNATRYIWSERKATKYFKLLLKLIKEEVTRL
jgi:hypothetical protein